MGSRNTFLALAAIGILFAGAGLLAISFQQDLARAAGGQDFLGSIDAVGFNFAPRGWATCDGQLLAISSNSALFSLLGTIYGGDGRTTFALPDLRGRVPMHQGNGPGLTPRKLGQKGGSETNTLSITQMPPHQHSTAVQKGAASSEATGDPASAGKSNALFNLTVGSGLPTGATGGGQAVNNMQPYQVVNYVIALVGIYPSRS